MIPYAFLALALIGSWGFSFYKGYKYADQTNIIRQQTAKIRHLEVSRRYFKEGVAVSEGEAAKAVAALEATAKKLQLLEDDIKAGKLGKACSDELFKRLK